MSQQLNKLKRRKGQIISQVDRFINFLNESSSKGKLESRLETVKPLMDNFNIVQEEIEELELTGTAKETQQEKIEEWDKERKEFEDLYHTAIGLDRDRLAEFNSVFQNDAENSDEQNQTSQIISNCLRPVNYNFPILNLPKFNGTYEKWLLYKDNFTATVDTNKEIPPVKKLQYLSGALEGDALQLISTITTSANNYTVAWELIKKRYDNKRLIINSHMKQLFEIPIVTKGNHTSLRSVIDHIQSHTQALKNLEQPVDQCCTVLIYLIINKLDFSTGKNWGSRINHDNAAILPTLEELLEFLTIKFQTLELVDRDRFNSHNSAKSFYNKRDKKVALASTSSTTCTICKGLHFIFQCEEFEKMDVPTRITEVKQNHLCLNCFGKGHFNKDCKASSFKICKRRHHTLLHVERQSFSSDKSQVESKESQQVSTVCAQPQSLNLIHSCKQNLNKNEVTAASAVNHSSQKQKVSQFTVLSTALIDIFDRGGNIHTCRVLLDTGSQPNMISTKLLNRLKISTENEELSVIAVAAIETGVHKSAEVKIK